jgi:transcriptional regulator with XRE-family HTH domain
MDQPHKSARYRYPSVVQVAEVLAGARHWLPWEREAPVRHSIRVLLILQGMSWARADWLGHSLVARGRIENGTRQPPGWDSDAELCEWLPDQACPICGKAFRRRWANQVFCSTKCADRQAEIEAYCIAQVGRVGPPQCRFCRSVMEIDNPAQEYCNQRCRERAHTIETQERVDKELGGRIAAARFARGLTQGQLAEMVGCTRGYITHVERGTLPGGEDLRQQILTILEIDPDAPPMDTTRLCAQCGEPYQAKRADAWYCGTNCQKRARRAAAKANGRCYEGHKPNGVGDPAEFDLGGRPGPRPVRARSAETRAP